jgi:UDP-N-acetylglucosamine 2-epimerase (non-hydrolysing)
MISRHKTKPEEIMSDKIKVMTIFGTRPEAIKMAPLVLELQKNPEIESIVCVSAQHRQMLDQVLDIFKIRPDYDLDVMRDRQTLTSITSSVLQGMDAVLKEAGPDIVLVHGDTTTAFTAALAAFYNQIPIGHVEAGLRTFDKYSPFPEEMNRQQISCLADLHFAPTENNRQNLYNESITDHIFITGNTVIDALSYTVQKGYIFETKELQEIDFDRKRVILVTAHRRENLGTPLENICLAIQKIASEFSDVEVIYPVHLNPAVRNTVFDLLGGIKNVHLIDPVSVVELHNIMQKSYMVMTDSGGLQEEAPSLGLPVLVLRNETERPEAVKAGTVKVAGVDSDRIYELAKTLLTDQTEYNKMAHAVNPYGDGQASKRIIEAILYYFQKTKTPPADFIA